MPNLFNLYVQITLLWGMQWDDVHSVTVGSDYLPSLTSVKHNERQIMRHDRKKLRRGEQQSQRHLVSPGISYAYKTMEGNSMNGLNHAPKLTGVNDTRVQPSDENELNPSTNTSAITTSEKVKIPTFEMQLTISSQYASLFDEHNLLKETFEYLLPRYGQEFSPKYHLDYLMIAISDEYPIRRNRRLSDNDGGITILSHYIHGELTFRDTDKSPPPSISEVISLTLSLLQSSNNEHDGDDNDNNKLSNKKFLQRLQSSVDPALRSVSRVDVSLSSLDDDMFSDAAEGVSNDGSGGGVPVGVNPTAIIGGVFIGIAFCLSVIAIFMLIMRRRQRKEEQLKTIVEMSLRKQGMMDESGDFDDSSSLTFENGQYYQNKRQEKQHQAGRSSSRVPRSVRGGQQQQRSRYPPGARSNASSLHGSSLHNDIQSIADMSMDDYRFDSLIGVGVDVDKRRFDSDTHPVPFRPFEAREVVNGMDGAVLVDESCWHRYAYPSPDEQINHSTTNKAALKANVCSSETRSEIVTLSSLDGGSVNYDSDDYLKAESATLASFTTDDYLDFIHRHMDHESPSFDCSDINDDVSVLDEKQPIDEGEDKDELNEDNNDELNEDNNDNYDDDVCEAEQEQDSSFISSSEDTYIGSFLSNEDGLNFDTINENDVTLDIHNEDNNPNNIYNDNDDVLENDNNKNTNDKKNDNDGHINNDSDQDDSTSVIISQQKKNQEQKIYIPLPHTKTSDDQQQQQQHQHHDDENRDVPTTTKTTMLTYNMITEDNHRERSPSSNFSSSASQRSNSSSISDERRSEATADEKNNDDGRSSSSPLFLCDVDDLRVSL